MRVQVWHLFTYTLLPCVLWLWTAGIGQGQNLSSEPSEFIQQLARVMASTNHAEAIAVGRRFTEVWQSGAFNAKQQEGIIAVSQLLLAKKLRTVVEWRQWLDVLYMAVDRGWQSERISHIIEVSQRAAKEYTPQKVSFYLQRLHEFVGKYSLFQSSFHQIFVQPTDFDIVWLDTPSSAAFVWVKGLLPAGRESSAAQQQTSVNTSNISGPFILLPQANMIYASPYDSIGIAALQGAYSFDQDVLIARGGTFSWYNFSYKTLADSVLAAQRADIRVEFSHWTYPVKEVRLVANDVTLHHSGLLKEAVQGRFEFISQKRIKENEARYPLFESYNENIRLEGLGKNIVYEGGVGLQGMQVIGFAHQRPYARLRVQQEGNKNVLEVRSRQFVLSPNQLRSAVSSFVFHIATDSLFHLNVSMEYQIEKDKTGKANHVIKFLRDKANAEMPFVDNYHKMYISADMAVYNIDNNRMDFFIVGARDRIPASFESYSYFDEQQYLGLQGVQDIHPVRLIQSALERFGSYNAVGEGEFYFDALLELTRRSEQQLLGLIRQMEKRGYLIYDEQSRKVKVLNRSTHQYASEQYKQVMGRIYQQVRKDTVGGKPLKSMERYAAALPEAVRKYLYHDYDDMLIQSVAPRDARRDSIARDTVYFKFPREKMYLAKLEGLDVYFTRWQLKSRPDSLASVPDTLIVVADTMRITNFKKEYSYRLFYELRRYDFNEKYFFLDALEGFYVLSRRFPGPPMPNASIDAEGGGMVIRGVERFDLSKRLNVSIIPKYKEITIFGNRVLMLEEGEVTVGNFRFIGKNFVLPYEEFRLTMGEIDTLLFSIPEKDNPKLQIWLGEEIRWGAGELQISYYNNKSGLKFGVVPGDEKDAYEAYPKLKILEGGTIYFDQLYRQRGAYHRQKVYFKIPGLTSDSLTSRIPQFRGVFYSNFFPPITEELQPVFDPEYDGLDSKYALGFVHHPQKPYPLYHTGGELITDSLVMFKTKLVALGKSNEIRHLTASLKSSQFIITSDSLVASQVSFDMKRGSVGGVNYPRAYGDKLRLKWITQLSGRKDTIRADSMLVYTRPQAPITLFEEDNPAAFRDGNLALTPQGLWADGILSRKDFWVLSPQMYIEPERLRTSESEFRINSRMADPFAIDDIFFYRYPAILLGNGVNIDFDLKGGLCRISPVPDILAANPEFPFITFPYAQFRTSIAEAIWDLGQQKIRMQGDTNSLFYSTRYIDTDIAEADKDLRFNATKGVYDISDINQPRLDLEGVPFIISADAKIIPDAGKITILKGADVQELHSARLIIDTLRQYHRFTDGRIKIFHRLAFAGRADYVYTNIAGDTFRLHFNDFELVRQVIGDTTRRRSRVKEIVYTRSTGEIKEQEQFFMAPRVQFKGSVEMVAPQPGLHFDGFIKLNLQSRKDLEAWIPFKSDSGEVVIQLPEKLSVGADVLTSGLLYDPVDGVLYATFLDNKRKFADQELFLASGELFYTAALNEFKIAPPAKIAGRQLQGNRLVFDDENGKILLDGRIRLLGDAFDRYVKQGVTGEVTLKENQFKFNASFFFDLPGPRGGFATMGSLLNYNKLENARLAEPDPVALKWKLASVLGDKPTELYMSNLQQMGAQAALPLSAADKSVSNYALVLSRVDLRWSPEERAFYSVGPIGISNVYGQDINAAYPGYIEIQKTSVGEIWHCYIELGEDMWFYFTMQNHILGAVSSVDEFNNQFARGRQPKREGEYGFELLEPGIARLFVEDFKSKYLGEKPRRQVEEKPRLPETDRDGF